MGGGYPTSAAPPPPLGLELSGISVPPLGITLSGIHQPQLGSTTKASSPASQEPTSPESGGAQSPQPSTAKATTTTSNARVPATSTSKPTSSPQPTSSPSGGIAAISLFDVPELQSQPASRSLPSTRWLFSRGSHIFPQAVSLAGAGFLYLAYAALPPATTATGGSLLSLRHVGINGAAVNGYLAAAALSVAIAPFTVCVMLPTTNFALIRMNAEKGGARSAGDGVAGKGGASEFTGLSRPQTRTQVSTAEEDENVRRLLEKFGKLNLVRAVLLGAGGVLGLWTALQG
ncbi:hypothetical protein DL764_010868 [Monosporascus ibericus]|uniref:Uncharacterized protein n=1 Tax=Monosporascus ibericus TaxID=155417 RepID=A0A4V1X8K5_9PEZI|nr:hypothetical protein DL764_010868 [Monosporascus ibericus]